MEDPQPNRSTFSAEEAREDLIAARDEYIFMRTSELREFISEKQPDDATRHMLALLQLPQRKTWTEKDLSNEFFLKTGLHLLYNKINDKNELHFGKSIHIRYLSFPKDVVDAMEENREITEEQEQLAKDIAVV